MCLRGVSIPLKQLASLSQAKGCKNVNVRLSLVWRCKCTTFYFTHQIFYNIFFQIFFIKLIVNKLEGKNFENFFKNRGKKGVKRGKISRCVIVFFRVFGEMAKKTHLSRGWWWYTIIRWYQIVILHIMYTIICAACIITPIYRLPINYFFALFCRMSLCVNGLIRWIV